MPEWYSIVHHSPARLVIVDPPRRAILIHLVIPNREDIVIQHPKDLVCPNRGLGRSRNEPRAIVMVTRIPEDVSDSSVGLA